MIRRLATPALLVLIAGFASAQTGPTLLTVFPPGAKAGETTEITVTGTGLDGDEQLLFSDKELKAERVGGAAVAADPKARQPGMKAAATTAVTFKVTVPKAARASVLDVRVVSKSGLSNPRAFAVGQLAEVNEKEPNNDAAEAQKVELNTTLNGVIAAPTDVDFVSVKVKAGQSVVVACLTTSIDSKMQADLMVAGPDGRPLAANRGYRDGDAVLDFRAPTDGEYLVRVAQFAYTTGGPDHFYRLTLTTGPWADAIFPPVFPRDSWTVYGRDLTGPESDGKTATVKNTPPFTIEPGALRSRRVVPPAAGMIDAVDGIAGSALDGNILLLTDGPVVLDNEANDTPDKAQPVKPPCDVAGRIEKKTDRDWYAFDAKKGDVWTLELFADRLGSPVDAYFTLTDEKGKVIAEVDDTPDTLSPNQFYTKSDDPARYRFTVPADGKYRVMVSTREAATQFGVRDQYVLRIAKEKPDFRLAVMPPAPHYPDAGTLPKGGAVLFSVFVFRFDGFDGPITLSASSLPPGVKCPPQVIGPGQTRGTLVLTADKDAADWAGFVSVKGTAGELGHEARPFTVVWPAVGVQANQTPNVPMITRMDRGPGLALAIRGEAPFKLTPTSDTVTVKPGGKAEVTLKVERKDGFKDAVQVFAATPNVGPRQQGNQPAPPVGTAAAGQTEVKVSLDVPNALPSGTHSLVLVGRSGVPEPKKGPAGVKPPPSYPAVPVTLVVEGKDAPKKK